MSEREGDEKKRRKKRERKEEIMGLYGEIKQERRKQDIETGERESKTE